MNYERTQKGNPHQLTVKQHILPARSIARFVNTSGRVSVFHKKAGKIIQAKPADQVFCAKRTWDQRAESGYMKSVEDKFQPLADAILNGHQKQIGPLEKWIVTDMFILWNIRSHRYKQPIKDQHINQGTAIYPELSKNDQEILERKHVSFIKPDFTMPGRSLAGLDIQRNMDMARAEMKDAQWGILTAKEGEFLVPDNFSNARILPLTPKRCLFSQSENDVIGLEEVREINRMALANDLTFWFARDVSKCPV